MTPASTTAGDEPLYPPDNLLHELTVWSVGIVVVCSPRAARLHDGRTRCDFFLQDIQVLACVVGFDQDRRVVKILNVLVISS